MNKIFREYFLDNPVFRLLVILKSINKTFEKQLQRNPFFKVGSSESINKILEKYLRRNLHFIKLFCICILFCSVWTKSLKYTCEDFFFEFSVLLVIFVIVLNAPLLKSLTSASVNHLKETPCLFTWCFLYIHICFNLHVCCIRR